MLPPMLPRPTKPILVVVAVSVAMSCPPFDGRDVLVAELQLCCGDDRVDLIGAAEARDGAVDRGVTQRPGDCDRARGRIMSACDRLQPFDQREVLGQLRLLEALAA